MLFFSPCLWLLLLLPFLLLFLRLAASSASGTSFRAHSVRSVATSTAFARNVPVSSLLEAASWCSASVFTSFYLRDVQFESNQGFSLGPFVAAGAVVYFAFLFLSHYTLHVFMYICILCRFFFPYGVMFVSPLQVVLSTCFESSSPYPLGSKVHDDVVVGLPFRVVFTFGIASRPCLDP